MLDPTRDNRKMSVVRLWLYGVRPLYATMALPYLTRALQIRRLVERGLKRKGK